MSRNYTNSLFSGLLCLMADTATGGGVATQEREQAGTPPTRQPTEQDRANADHAKEVKDSCRMIRHGFETTRDGKRDFALDIQVRNIIATAFNADAPDIEKGDIYGATEKRAAEMNPDEIADQWREKIHAAVTALKKAASRRVSLEGGVNAAEFVANYVGFGTKGEKSQQMLNAAR